MQRNFGAKTRPYPQPSAVEALEPRRLFAEASLLLPPEAIAFIGPIYVPSPPPPRVAGGAIVIRKLLSTESEDIAVMDVTFSDNHPQFERGFWSGPTQWNGTTKGQFDDSRARVEEIARIVRDGGKERWTKQLVRSNAFTLLDFENPYFEVKAPDYMAQRIKWFKQIAPDAPVSSYGYTIDNSRLNRDHLASPTSTQFAAYKADLEALRPYVNELSAMSISCYMLGPARVDTDLAAMINISRAFREVYPTKPLIAHAWGAYHTTWNKENSVLSDSVTQRYVDVIRTYYDGITVWGPAQDNVKLLSLLSDPDNRKRLPRPATPGTVPLRDDTRPVGTPITSTPIELDEVPAIINEIDL